MLVLADSRSRQPPCALVYSQDRVVLGTYELQQDSRCRVGSIEVRHPRTLEIESITPTSSAVLDLRIYKNRLWTAHSTGEVKIWSFDGTNVGLLDEFPVADANTLVTQIAFSDNKVGATLTSGEVKLFDIGVDAVKEIYSAKTHDLEAWTLSFDDNSGYGIYSGGDDSVFAYSDIRSATGWKMRHHQAGVTSILPRAGSDMWTGGYDDNVREIDVRNRKEIRSNNLGGGIWKLIPDSTTSNVLVCAMYAGLRVLSSLNTVEAALTNHDSMVYAGAWSPEKGVGYTCSFYDCLVQKWTMYK